MCLHNMDNKAQGNPINKQARFLPVTPEWPPLLL